MNHSCELGFKAWLEAEGLAVPVHTGLTYEEIPPSEQIIDCFCGDSEHKVGPLYLVNMRVILSTPPSADSGNDAAAALTAHKDVLATLRSLVEDFDSSQLKTVFDATTGDEFSGAFLEGEDEAIDDGRWITTVNFKFGLKRGA